MSSEIEIRRARAGEFPAILDIDGASFGIPYTESDVVDAAIDMPLECFVVAAHDDRIVGVSAETPIPMSLPGGADVPVTGLTWVSVELTYRRRGILRQMMAKQLREHAAAGQTATVLFASEGSIYGRYGFGVASRVRHNVIDRRSARLAVPADVSAVSRVRTDEARTLVPALYERWRAITPGAVGFPDTRWEFWFHDFGHQRGGMTELMHLVHPDGYLSYRLKMDWQEGDARHECHVVDYAPVSEQAHAALWQILLSFDLVGTIDTRRLPVDDPLPDLLVNQRHVRTVSESDQAWVRPLDVCALLGSRRYGVEVEAVLAVVDPVLGDGRYLLRGGPDGAECTRTDAAPDVTLGVAALGAVSTGGTRLRHLARLGRVDAADELLLGRLDRALIADRAPCLGVKI